MELALIIIIAVLSTIIFAQRSKNLSVSRDIEYIQAKLEGIIESGSDERIKLFTSNKEIKKFVVTVNNLLDSNSENATKYNKTKISMKKMLSNISHDLKTPLTIILGYVEILQLRDVERTMTDKIYVKATEILELINKFFDLAKLESGDKKIEISKVDICEICRTTILNFYDKLQSMEMEILIDIPEKELFVLGNEDAIVRILNNLISNSIRYGSFGKYLALVINEGEEDITISIIDRGKGIDEKYKDEVFDSAMNNKSYETLKRIGSIIEYPAFYDKLTAKENLELHCEYMGYHNKEDIEKVLKMVKLTSNNTKVVKEFSLGMKQRLGLARAIVTKPELLILDEPINGLDPEGIREIRELLKLLCKEYRITILISSHILSEIEQIADTIGVLSEGRLIKEIAMNEVRKFNTEYIEIEVEINDCKKATYILDNTLEIKNFKLIDGNKIRIYISCKFELTLKHVGNFHI